MESGQAGEAGVWGTGLSEPPSTKHPDSGALAQTHEGPFKAQRLPGKTIPAEGLWTEVPPSPYLQRFTPHTGSFCSHSNGLWQVTTLKAFDCLTFKGKLKPREGQKAD